MATKLNQKTGKYEVVGEEKKIRDIINDPDWKCDRLIAEDDHIAMIFSYKDTGQTKDVVSKKFVLRPNNSITN